MKTRLIHACMFTPTSNGGWGLPLVLIGPPGIAKSSTFSDLSKSTGLHCEILSVGERGEGAFGVTPVPSENGHGMVLDYPPPSWIKQLRIDKEGTEAGVVLIDEINTAPPALQPALMGAVLDKRFGGHKCGPRVRIFGAMNPVGHAAGGWDIAAPVANRFGHLKWECPDATEWVAWLCGGSSQLQPVDIDAEEMRVTEAWPAAYAKASGLVSAFVMRRPELLHKQPADSDPAASGPWPSPRTWDFATRALAASYVHGLTEVEADELISAFVGNEAASEFVAWIEGQDLPDPVDLLEGNVKWAHDPTRFDRTVAVLASCVALVTPSDAVKRDNRAEALWKILATLMETAKDLAVPPATALAKAGLSKICPAAKPVMVKLHNVVMAAKDKEL